MGDGEEILPPQTGFEITINSLNILSIIGLVYILKKGIKIIKIKCN